MSDMTAAIVPKSDQLNADDCISGPITIKIASVTIRGGQEQPVSIHYENDNGKPYKPCKSMSRVLVAAWGPDANAYVGRGLTLYRDPGVKWAGMDVGGLRISHMTDIETAMTMALTATKGSRKPFTVKPLVVADAAPEVDWSARINACATLDELGKVWAACPDKKRLAGLKDARKVALSAKPADKPETAWDDNPAEPT